jgi:predicted transcriptional regulator of viral defense system
MMTERKLKKSQVGVELVRVLASEGDRIFSTQRARELAPRVGMNASYVVEALHHLRNNGWIVSLRRGLYALSSSVPGVTAVHEFEIASALVTPAAISHWSALHYHGMTDQVPRRVFVLTTAGASVPRARGTRSTRGGNTVRIGEATYQFIQVKPERFFGTGRAWIGQSRVPVTDPERTLLDGLSRPQYCGDFAEVLQAFEVWGNHLRIDRIIDYALRLDGAISKRLGWVLESRGVPAGQLSPLQQLAIKGYRKLDPTGPREGPLNRFWMIQENLPGRLQL